MRHYLIHAAVIVYALVMASEMLPFLRHQPVSTERLQTTAKTHHERATRTAMAKKTDDLRQIRELLDPSTSGRQPETPQTAAPPLTPETDDSASSAPVTQASLLAEAKAEALQIEALAQTHQDSAAAKLEFPQTSHNSPSEQLHALHKYGVEALHALRDQLPAADGGANSGERGRILLSRQRDLVAGRRRAKLSTRSNDAFTTELRNAPPGPSRVFNGTFTEPTWFYIDTWHTLGPFPNPRRANLHHSFPPEHLIDLDATYLGRDRSVLSWQFHQSDTLRVVPPQMDTYTIHYAYTEIRSDRERTLWITFPSDDYLRAWLNDDLIWSSATQYKGWRISEGFRQVTLRPGYNRLLIRLENAIRGGEFSTLFRLE